MNGHKIQVDIVSTGMLLSLLPSLSLSLPPSLCLMEAVDGQKMNHLVLYRLTKRRQQVLVLRGHYVDSCFEVRQAVLDVVHQKPVECAREKLGAIPVSYGWVFLLQEVVLIPHLALHLLVNGIVKVLTSKTPALRLNALLMEFFFHASEMIRLINSVLIYTGL